MRVLFVSGELIAGDLCYRLKQEGCKVKLFILDKSRKDCFDGMVEKTDDWEKELKWVGKDGLIVFDDVGFGKVQDRLREEGYNVVGGSSGGDKLEKEREFAQIMFSTYGLTAIKTLNFESIAKAINFIKHNRGPWVIKQNGHIGALNYVGIMPDGSDAISILKNYRQFNKKIGTISLQKKVTGVEVGVARYFNGDDWIGPIEINVEHKCLFHGEIGPLTGEMGTVMWYTENENIKIFQDTLAKMKPFLQKMKYKGNIDINCIVDEKYAYPLEATTRFGCPATQLQDELHVSPWKDFLMAVAKGEEYDLKYKKGFGVVVSIAVPPFPYKGISKMYYDKGAHIIFKKRLTDSETDRVHFEEVCLKRVDGKSQYCVAGSNGYILYITGFGSTISKARKQAYDLVDKIAIPKMFYRMDIGESFMNDGYKKLKKWGWI